MKRLLNRRSGGEFRRATISDIGLSHCPKCGAIYRWAPIPDDGSRFVDSHQVFPRSRSCPNCNGGSGEVTALTTAPDQEAQP